MAGMSKRTQLMLRIFVELLLAVAFLYSSVRRFNTPQFGWPSYIYIGNAILPLLIAVIFIADAARIARRLRIPLPKD